MNIFSQVNIEGLNDAEWYICEQVLGSKHADDYDYDGLNTGHKYFRVKNVTFTPWQSTQSTLVPNHYVASWGDEEENLDDSWNFINILVRTKSIPSQNLSIQYEYVITSDSLEERITFIPK